MQLLVYCFNTFALDEDSVCSSDGSSVVILQFITFSIIQSRLLFMFTFKSSARLVLSVLLSVDDQALCLACIFALVSNLLTVLIKSQRKVHRN